MNTKRCTPIFQTSTFGRFFKKLNRNRSAVSLILVVSCILQISISSSHALGPVPTSSDPQTIPFIGITPSSNNWSRLIEGITGGPTQMIFDDSGNAWGMQNGNCLVKIVPNSTGTSVSVEAIYGTKGGGCAGTPAVNVTTENNVFNFAGSGTAYKLAWLDSDRIVIVSKDKLYVWNTLAVPNSSALSQYSSLGGSKITLDSHGNIYLLQSSANNGLGDQIKVTKILQNSPNLGTTVLTAGVTLSNTCVTFGEIAMSPSDILYVNCAIGGASSKTFFVDFSSNVLTQFANPFAKGPMAFDAQGNLYIAQTISIDGGQIWWPILTKYNSLGVVMSYWPYNADRDGVSIDPAGNLYAYHPWGYIEKVAGSSPPFPPTRVSSSAGNSSASVSWLAPSLAGFTTYTATALPGGAFCTTTWPTATCSISGLTGGITYSVSVTASNSTGTSAASGSSSVVPYSVPGASTIGIVTALSSSSISIPYTAGTNNGSAITGYTTTSSPSVSLTLTSTATANPLTYSGSFVQGQAYTFSMSAINGAGTSPSWSSSNSITPYAAAAPAAGIIGSVTRVSDTSVAVPFTAPSTNGSAITSYTVASSPAVSLTYSGTTSPMAVSGTFVQGQSYTFTIAATNGAGTGGMSSSSNGVIPFAVAKPDAPIIGSATLVDSQTVTVGFSAPLNNHGSAITRYRATSNPGAVTATSTGSPITVTGLTVNTAYTFTVTATNSVGESDSSTATIAVTPLMSYMVTFNSQSGSSIANGSFVSGSTVSAPSAPPTRSGYTFNGWFLATSGGNALVFPYAPGVTTAITLFAQWALIPVVIPVVAPPVAQSGPPPSILKSITSPKVSRDEKGFYCEIGKYVFLRDGRTEELPKLTLRVFSLMANGKVTETIKSTLDKVAFTKNELVTNVTITCQVEARQENLVTTSSSLNTVLIAQYSQERKLAIEAIYVKYYKDRADAYAKKSQEFVRLVSVKTTAMNAAKTTKAKISASLAYQKAFSMASSTWKNELLDATNNREQAKVLAQKQYLDALEIAGVSIFQKS